MSQTCLQSGSSSMLVSFSSSAAFSAGLRAGCGAPESPQNQPQSSFPQDLRGAEGPRSEGEGSRRERQGQVEKESDERAGKRKRGETNRQKRVRCTERGAMGQSP